jgi:uncharacterized protein with HEPN domain
MSDRPVKLILQDMLDSVTDILTYTHGMDEQGFYNDKKTRDAVERNLEILGEAANRLPQDFHLKHGYIEWHRIISLRNRLIHAYFNIKEDIIWNVIVNYLPPLKIQLEKISKSL